MRERKRLSGNRDDGAPLVAAVRLDLQVDLAVARSRCWTPDAHPIDGDLRRPGASGSRRDRHLHVFRTPARNVRSRVDAVRARRRRVLAHAERLSADHHGTGPRRAGSV